MVQTRRKTAAAAQDGAVLTENKAGPPAAQQTPTKHRKRGRPPKIKSELSKELPTTSDVIIPNKEIKNEEIIDFDSQESSDSLYANEADSCLEKEEDAEPSAPISKRKSTSVEKPKLTKRRSKMRIKEEEPPEIPETSEEAEKSEDVPPTSPQHPEDPQPSTSKAPIEIAIKMEPIEAPTVSEKEGVQKPDESESMDIADSESESDGENVIKIDDSILNVPLPKSPPPLPRKKEEIRVEIEQSGATWNRSEGLSSPSTISRPKIHFLHPAYSSFRGDSSMTSPTSSSQPAPPPPTASSSTSTSSESKQENGFSMSFKKKPFNKIVGSATNPLTASEEKKESVNSEDVAVKIEEPPSESTSSSPPPKIPIPRSTNFSTNGQTALPPPQMVELPKLSFFNGNPSAVAANNEENEEEESSSEDPKPETSSSSASVSSSTVRPAPTQCKISDADIRAVKAKAERVAQDIARRRVDDHHRHKNEDHRDDYDRRRDDRDRRYRRSESDRFDSGSGSRRQREDDERRARERREEVTKRHEREREEERRRKEEEEEKRRMKEKEEKEEEERRRKEAEEEEERKRKKAEEEEEERQRREEMKVPEYELLTECKYLTRNALKKKTESLVCECYKTGGNCSDDTCVNRAMLTECPASCPAKCKNQRFAKHKFASVEAFHTGTPKGCGLRALKDIKKGRFIIEYMGEVVERDDYEKRKMKYAADKKHKHHYLCDTGIYTIDATVYGNASRFVNHSCDPNAVCEKWSVPRTPGDVSRIGFFAKRNIKAGEEITFDYQFVNYGRDAQQCFCGAATCNGWIGQKPEEFSSDEEDEDEDVITTRHINMDEEEEEKLEELNELEPHERIELINEMLDDLVIRNKKHARKVITIAARMTDHEQRDRLIKEIFSADTSLGTQSHYAKEGMATLMAEWLSADDYSLANLKLVQTTLQSFHGDVFVACAKSDRFLLEMLNRWLNAQMDESVDIHVVADSLVTCVAEPEKKYSDVREDTFKEIVANFNRVKEMAFRLNHHWFNRSVSFRIPKKIHKETENKQQPDVSFPSSSSQNSESNNHHHRPNSPVHYQRNNHSSYSTSYYDQREQPQNIRFFNNGNDVLQYRFTGYYGNNYKANWPAARRASYKDSYRERRRFGGRGGRSRSRSRSSSPHQAYKRRRYEDRDRNRSIDRRSRSPDVARERNNRLKAEIEEAVRVKSAAAEEMLKNRPTSSNYEEPTTAAAPAPVQPYQMTGYESYGVYDQGTYIYPQGGAYYPPPVLYPPPHHSVLQYSIETLPSIDQLNEIYETCTLEQMEERVQKIQEELQIARRHLEQKRTAAAEEARRREAESRPVYEWAKAKAETGEIYYYNKVTKETQWTPPTADQGLLDPSDPASPDTAAVTTSNEDPEEPVNVKEEVVEQETQEEKTEDEEARGRRTPSEAPPSTSSPRREERERNRRDGSRHRESNSSSSQRRPSEYDRRGSSSHHHGGSSSSSSSHREERIRSFRVKLEKSAFQAVKWHPRLREMREATEERRMWLGKTIAKEILKREQSQNNFDYRFTDNTDKKVKNYTKLLIDRKLVSNDLWKEYNGR